MFKENRHPLVSIIDYGMGNLFSVKKACEYANLRVIVTSNKDEFISSDAAILPGVGAFAQAMKNLEKLDLIKPIVDFIESGRPFIGICLGMQLLMSESEEFGRHKGLDIIRGSVLRFTSKNKDGQIIKIPQVGWNRISKPSFINTYAWNDSLLQGIQDGEFMYFVHSFYCKPDNEKISLSTTRYYDTEYCSSIIRKNIFATQFHPERSAVAGLKIYKNLALLLNSSYSE